MSYTTKYKVSQTDEYYKVELSTLLGLFFCPSQDELRAMYDELHLYGLGGFDNKQYWSSTEWIANFARNIDFSDGNLYNSSKGNNNLDVRGCWSFTAAPGAYNLRDTGPTGGLIFIANGSTYYEAPLTDQGTLLAWSNVTNTLIGTTGTAVGTGFANTTDIIAQPGHTDSAAKQCKLYEP